MPDFTGPGARQGQRPGGRRLRQSQQSGGKQQPRPRIGLHDIGWRATGMPGPGNTLHRGKRRDSHLDAGAGGQCGKGARGEPNRGPERDLVGRRTSFVTQPVRNGQHDLPSLCRIGAISGCHTLGSQIHQAWSSQEAATVQDHRPGGTDGHGVCLPRLVFAVSRRFHAKDEADAAAQTLTGLGDKFGAAIVNADAVLGDVNPPMPQAHYDVQRLAALGDTYADAGPDSWDALDHAMTTAHTLNRQESDLDAALLAAAALGDTGADVFGRGGPYLARGAADPAPTSQLLDEYSPEIFCTLRNYHDVAPKVYADLGNNGYALGARSSGAIAGAPGPYIYPENLPRTNAKGGPEGRPGCWQTIARELWPAPYLVMDDGASIAPYDHFDVGSPLVVEYVWGRQLGDNTINP